MKERKDKNHVKSTKLLIVNENIAYAIIFIAYVYINLYIVRGQRTEYKSIANYALCISRRS
jgi:hypothetical protein